MRPVWQAPAVCLITATLLSLSALATHTLFWRTSSYPDFERGTANGVALWSDGMLTPAAKFSTFADPNLAFLWSLRVDSQGRLYASGGSNARVFRFDAQGHATTVFQSPELTAQAIALDAHDDLYVATSPDGKVYKVTPNGQSSVFFNPQTKYIWSLVVDSQGDVYAGTGDTGEVFVVTPAGKSRLFFKSDERHIRALALDGKGNLIVGTDPSGLVIRVAIERAGAGEPPKAGRAFVLYETGGQEITALNVDSQGNIYAASIGFKRAASSPAAVPVPGETFIFSAQSPVVTAGEPAQARPGQPAPTPQAATPQAVPFNPFAAAPEGGSHVYRIAPDGSPTLLWQSPTDLVYSLGFSPDGKLLLGTGNNGSVIELQGDELFSKAAETSSGQVTGFVSGPGGRIFLCTANPGKIFSLGPATTAEGTFISAPFDAKIFSHWGRLNWWGPGASGGQVSFYVRSGNTSNPDENWSQWYGPYNTPEAQQVESPPSRFAQWKAVFHPAAGTIPSLSWVSLAYLPKNVAPEIDDIVMEDPGVGVRGMQIPEMGESILPVQLRMPKNNPSAQDSSVAPEAAVSAVSFQPPPQGFREKGWQSVLWSSHDANGDQLDYSVYYRGEGEHVWKLLKGNLRTTFYSWDTATMPDGAYYLKIVASDAPSNPPADALTADRIGPRFVVDNTPPGISGLRAQTAADDATIQFTAKDPSTPLARAEYSVDAGQWTVVDPVGQLSDAPSETYQIVLKPLSAGEHTISVRVFDLYDNSGIAKITFTVPQKKSSGQ